VTKLRELFDKNRARWANWPCMKRAPPRRRELGACQPGARSWDDYLQVSRKSPGKDYGTRDTFGMTHKRIAVHEPVGVVGAITPWNVPLYVNIGKVVAALLPAAP